MVQVPVSEMSFSSSSSSSSSSLPSPVRIRRQDLTKSPLMPPSWDHQREPVQVVEVGRGTADFALVARTLTDPARGEFVAGEVEVVKVERIQNRALLHRYHTEREIAMGRRGAGALNEQYLFFGSKGFAPLDIARSEEGFLVEAR